VLPRGEDSAEVLVVDVRDLDLREGTMAVNVFKVPKSVPDEIAESAEKTRASFLRERKDAVYENLRDLNFEHKAGKIAENDYQGMRDALEEEAAALIAEIDRLENGAEPPKDQGRPRPGTLAPASARTKGNRK